MVCVILTGSNLKEAKRMGLLSKLKMRGKSNASKDQEPKVLVTTSKSKKSDCMVLFREFLIKTSSQNHIIDLNEKKHLPPEISDLSVEELVNIAFTLIQNDQLDAKLIGEIIII